MREQTPEALIHDLRNEVLLLQSLLRNANFDIAMLKARLNERELEQPMVATNSDEY